MLPDGFEWQYILAGHGTPDTLMCDGYEVARLWQHVQTKQWHARLLLPGGRDRNVPCRSFESGKAGCETWACRHEARLRAEVATHIAQRRR